MIRQVNLQAMDPFCTTLTNRIGTKILTKEESEQMLKEMGIGTAEGVK